MPSIGIVKYDETTDAYAGELRTLSIRAKVQLVPVHKTRDSQPDYRILSENVEVGAAWKRVSTNSGNEYLSLSIAAPEFGRRKLFANLGRAAGQDDPSVYAIIWNTDDE